MATGDADDVGKRLRAVIPPWFPDPVDSPILQSLLSGIAGGFAFVYDYLGFAKKQTRIRSATGGWLDLIAWDFFGARFLRRQGESDESWQPRIQKEILRPRQTRAALSQMMTDLTSREPVIIELFNPGDCGGYDVPQAGGYDVGPIIYGSLDYPNQVFITASRAPSEGIPVVGGYDSYNLAYDGGIGEYADIAWVIGPLTDAEIYARIAQTAAAGITPWTALES
jgi:hypothetical protein